MVRLIIDAENAVFGRLCSLTAKKILEGNEVIIVNSEKSIISGDRSNAIKRYQTLRKKGGHSLKGPRYSKFAYMLLKRGIRGMLPNHREGIGKEALARVKCYNGIPAEFSKEKIIKIETKTPIKYVKLGEVVRGI